MYKIWKFDFQFSWIEIETDSEKLQAVDPNLWVGYCDYKTKNTRVNEIMNKTFLWCVLKFDVLHLSGLVFKII